MNMTIKVRPLSDDREDEIVIIEKQHAGE